MQSSHIIMLPDANTRKCKRYGFLVQSAIVSVIKCDVMTSCDDK